MSPVRTSELARRAGVNAETLRYYERRGLLTPPPRSEAGYRDYPPDAVSVLRFVKRAQDLGFSLAEVEDLLHLAEGGPDACDAVREAAGSKLRDLEQRLADLERMRSSLVELLERCELPPADRRCSLLRALGAAEEGG
jgi:MerR family mercuric resistance operon transcriptional regulator